MTTDEKGTIIDKEKAICKYCSTELKYQGSSTSNLQYHFNSYHLKNEVTKASPVGTSQPSIAEFFGSVKTYSTSSLRHSILQRCVAEVMIENLLPFATVSSKSFTNLMKDLDPIFQLSSRQTFSEVVLPKTYANLRKDVEKMLQPVQSLACTTDGWTSAATESYISLTCHLIDEEWNIMPCVCKPDTILSLTLQNI